MMKNHRISIIIISRNKPNCLGHVLDRLCSQIIPAREIIIIHTGSRNSAQQMLSEYRERLPVKYFFEPGKRVSAARNKGVAVSNGSILAFLGADCVPCRGWTETIERFFSERSDAQVLQGNILCDSSKSAIFADAHYAEHRRWLDGMLKETPGYVSTIFAQNFAVRGELIRRFRMPFDERLETNEDVEFYWKIRQKEIRVVFSEELEVTQYRVENLPSFLSAAYNYGIGKARVRKIQDDFWDDYCVHSESFASVLSWIRREMRSSYLKQYFKRLLKEDKWIEAFSFYPLTAAQRIAFVSGYLRGQKEKIPDYGYFVTPIDLQLFLTNQCNLRCRHCFFRESLKDEIQELTAQNIEKMLKRLNRDLRTVSMGGGDPFLNDDIVNICKAFAEQIHVKNVYIVTNGFDTSRVVKSVEKILETANFNLFVRVSIDGLNESHNRIRNNLRSFQNAVKTIKQLRNFARKENRLQVSVQTTIGRGNLNELEDLAKFVIKELNVFLAFDIVRDSRLFSPNPDFIETSYGPYDPSMLLDADQLKNVEKYVQSIYERHFTKDDTFCHQIEFQMRLIGIGCRQAIQKERLIPCSSGESFAVIYQNYDVAICEATRPIGNLLKFDLDLKDLMEKRFSSRLKDLRDSCYCTNSCNNSSSMITAWEL